jgi:hypothetical protein
MNWTNADDQWIHLIAEDTIEQRMLGTLEAKRGVADGILDRVGDLKAVKLKRGASSRHVLGREQAVNSTFPCGVQ